MGALSSFLDREGSVNRLWLLVCASFKREVMAALNEEGHENVRVSVFPSFCGLPPMGAEDLVRCLPEDLGPTDSVHILGGGCLLGKLDPTALPPLWQIHRLDVCQGMLAGNTLCKEKASKGAYLLSAGWLSSWRPAATAPKRRARGDHPLVLHCQRSRRDL